MKDSYKHKGLRERLVLSLEEQGISDEVVLGAMRKVPRHLFVESAFEDYAYEDRAFSILSNQTISRPLTVGFQSQLLEVEQGQKVLEIGTGSGYQTAVLVEMGLQVYTIERQKKLFDFSSKVLRMVGCIPEYQSFGDGYLGFPNFAPFDAVLVTCGAEEIPKKLLEQLKIGGKMIIPIGGGENQIMTKITKMSDDEYETKEYGGFSFVPMLGRRV
ncbi:MAG: protein-L-isoaspartate(D-aspartate) O-methyltransferase [Flavobacteriales bacterium]|nr:protein-L-isoaspartate(D-aspartate) O-methyltransferase [Flavobacteriales bacterium]